MNLIKLEGVCKRFGEKNLFNNLSMEIEPVSYTHLAAAASAEFTTASVLSYEGYCA